jgi:hypothetical protein
MAEGVANVSALVVDCADPPSLAAFWQALLGGDVVPYTEFDAVALRAPGVTFDFVRNEDRKQSKNRWHLDLASDDPAALVAIALKAGGTRADDVCVSELFTVMRDPEGNEFCVLRDASTSAPWASPPA